jgi:hypothetical protein
LKFSINDIQAFARMLILLRFNFTTTASRHFERGQRRRKNQRGIKGKDETSGTEQDDDICSTTKDKERYNSRGCHQRTGTPCGKKTKVQS